jgi:chromosomal replication initiator protein
MLDFDLNDLWQKVLSIIEKQVTQPSFETWLKPIKPIYFDNHTMTIEVPNEFAKYWLEIRYNELIKKSLEEVTNLEMVLTLVLPDSSEPLSRQCTTSAEDIIPINLNPRYTFDTFVVGTSNRFAHSAALAVAESPARSYNPLFVYGGVGLGKTHLIQAIAHNVLQNTPDAKVFYVSSEKFTYELINSIRDNKIVKFWDKYRNVDVLLIDDIHFLAGKERTQEEFFHTFNALYEANKQIIISSAKSPKQIPALDESLCIRGSLNQNCSIFIIQTKPNYFGSC